MNLFSVLSWLGRLLLGSTFAILGWQAASAPGPRVDMAARTLDIMRKVLPLPHDDALIVRMNGGAQAAAGALLALGVLPGAASALLAATLVPTTIAGHDFWNVEDPMMHKMQQVHFQKNLAMLGGLLFIVGSGETGSRRFGRSPRSLWRRKHELTPLVG